MIIRIMAGEISLEFELQRDATAHMLVDGGSTDLGKWEKDGNTLEIMVSEEALKGAFTSVVASAAKDHDSKDVLIFELD